MGVPVLGHAGAQQPAPAVHVYLSQSVGQSVSWSVYQLLAAVSTTRCGLTRLLVAFSTCDDDLPRLCCPPGAYHTELFPPETERQGEARGEREQGGKRGQLSREPTFPSSLTVCVCD